MFGTAPIRLLRFWPSVAASLVFASGSGTLHVQITDTSGALVPTATLIVRNAYQTPVGEVSCHDGECIARRLPGGSLAVEARADQFESAWTRITIADQGEYSLAIRLNPGPVRTAVTVTASRGAVETVEESPQRIAVADRSSLFQRPLATLGGAFHSEPGILVQESTYGQASPFLRGLTGYHVLNLIDGVRLNNSTFRSGPNQFLAFVEPGQAERVEAALGPAGSQYGSDALGGAINVVSPEPRFSRGDFRAHGDVNVFSGYADRSGGGNVRAGLGTGRVWWLAGIGLRRHNDLRAGNGADSRHVFRRLFGLNTAQIQTMFGDRLRGTGFAQYGLNAKLSLRPAPGQDLTLWYQNSASEGVEGYKDLLGGLGRLRSDFTPQVLHFFYARHEMRSVGPFDSISGAFSFNSQKDGSARQGLRPSDAITRDRATVDVYGSSLQAASHLAGRHSIVFGGEVYDERINASRLVETSGNSFHVRPLYPNGSRYRTIGVFGQDTIDLVPGTLRMLVGGRFSAVQFRAFEDRNRGPSGESFGVVDASQAFRDLTFNTSLLWQVNDALGLTALCGRGFRAPNLNDLGAIGLNDLGYEIPASEAIPAGALLGASAGDGAAPAGRPIAPLGPERLFNYELGARLRAGRLYARIHAFDAELLSPIVRRTLLFPANQIPGNLAGVSVFPIPATPEQMRHGVVAVSAASDPRAVKAFVNDGHSRYLGLEGLLRFSISSRWAVEANYSVLAGRDLYPNRPVRRLPPQSGGAIVRYVPRRMPRAWLALGVSAAGPQERLSGGDIDDERIGSSRRRRDIEDFFRGGLAAAWIDANAIFLPTGETLDRIKDRVLPLGAAVNGVRVADDNTRVPLFIRTEGWYALDLTGALPLGERVSLQFALVNLLDRNYRVHGSGIDAPGLNAYLNLRYSF